jgi:archaellum component FlaC
MATIGSISVAFEADAEGLQSGIDSIVQSLERMSATIDAVSENLSRLSSLSVSVNVRTDSLDAAAESVAELDKGIESAVKTTEDSTKAFEDLSESIEVISEGSEELAEAVEEVESRVETVARQARQASSSFAVLFSRQASASVRAYGQSLKEVGQSSLTAFQSLGRAVSAVGQVMSGTSLSLDGLVKAVGRSVTAFGEWKVVLGSAAAATGLFLQFSGGARTVLAALSGNASSMTRVFAAAGAAVAVAGTGLAVYSGIVATARLATSQLSQESQGYVVAATRAVTASTVFAASLYAGNAAFAAMYRALSTSSTAAEAFAKVTGSASSAAMSGFSRVAASLEKLNILLNVAKVASGAYRQELAAMGAEANSIQDMADRFGSTTQELEILSRAARDAGVSMGFLAKGQQNLFTSISKIRIGQLNTESTREAKIAFDRLNISVDELRAKRPQEIFELVAQRLTAVEDASDRTAIAFDLFGKQGAAILPALKNLKEVQADAARLGTTLSNIDFRAFNELGASFNRAREASRNLSKTFLISLAPIQTGWNNLVADVQGGIVAAFGPIATVMAKAVVPLQVFFEATGRIVNILLRLAGAAATVYVALVPPANTLAGPWKVLGSAIMDVLGVIEVAVGVIEGIANAFLTELTPAVDEFMAPANSFAEWLTKIGVFAGYFALVVVAITATNVAFQTMAIVSGTTAASTAGSASIISVAYTRMSAAVVASLARIKTALGITALPFEGLATAALRAFKLIVVGATETAVTFSTRMAMMGLSAIQGWIAPFLAGVASFVTGTTIASTAATISAAAMAAAWVVATLGLAAIVVAIVAVVQNFDSLYDYFSNFTENVSRLFTWDGIKEAAKNVANALRDTFKDLSGRVGSFFTNMAAGILRAVSGARPVAEVEKIDAAVARVEEVAMKRREVALADWERKRADADQFNMARASMSLTALPEVQISPPPVDETESLVSAIENARDKMSDLVVEAGKFGSAGKTAIVAAQEQFAKLQQQLSEGEIRPASADEKGLSEADIFAKRAQKIRDDLQKNLDLSNVLSTEVVNEFSQSVSKSFDAIQVRFDKLARGTDLGSTFTASRLFPTSREIKEEAIRVSNTLAAEERAIAKRLADGDFGRDAGAAKRAQAAVEDARFRAEIEFGKIDADVSFANEIRKSLEEAFLDPIDKFERKIKEIDANKSLSPVEKSLASVDAQRQFVESTFGKTTGDTLREREKAFAAANATDRFDRTAFMSAEGTRAGGEARSAMERNRLDMQRRESLGLEATPSQVLQAGVDSINDIFDVFGLTIEEVQNKLDPEKFAEYQEALKKNTEAVKESLGVEKTGAEKIAESRAKLDQALRDGIISQEERDKALKQQRDSLLSSLGISKSPAEDFEDAVAKIQENASELSPEELQKGLKEAKDRLLDALGIDKSPAQQAEDALNKLQEAFSKGLISQEELNKGTQAVTDSLLQKFGVALDPVEQFRQRMKDIDEAVQKNQISTEQATKAQDEARRSLLPGGEAKSPVEKFQDDMKSLRKALDGGDIDEEDFAKRRLNLQAELEDSLGSALDNVGQDRRQVGASDARSREGVDTFFRIIQGRDNPSLKAQLEIAKNTRLLAEAANDPDAAPVIANFAAR